MPYSVYNEIFELVKKKISEEVDQILQLQQLNTLQTSREDLQKTTGIFERLMNNEQPRPNIINGIIDKRSFEYKTEMPFMEKNIESVELNFLTLLSEVAALLPEEEDFNSIRQSIIIIKDVLTKDNQIAIDELANICLHIKAMDPAEIYRKIAARWQIAKHRSEILKAKLEKSKTQLQKEIESFKIKEKARLATQYYKEIYKKGKVQGYYEGHQEGLKTAREEIYDEAVEALSQKPTLKKDVFSHWLYSIDNME